MTSPVFFHSGEDPLMRQAHQRARESFGVFWREMSWEHRRIIPGLQMAAVKASFTGTAAEGDEPPIEHMWVSDLAFDGHVLRGELVNTAHDIPGLVAGTPVTVSLGDVEDWMYVSAGAVCGGFTVQVTRAQMDERQRAAHDQAWGLEFVPPDQILLMPQQAREQQAPKRAGWAGLMRGKLRPAAPLGLEYGAALEGARAVEHPMSENSTATIQEQLAGQPDAATMVLDDGWTLLHLDAVGGNLGPVQALLSAGADRQARTPQGDTAADLAQRMGWPRVVAALQA